MAAVSAVSGRTFAWVLGGVLTVGFVGLFIGPTSLAVGYSLMREWTGIEPAVVNDIS
jgi:predicted PurR-regulated permease PerM